MRTLKPSFSFNGNRFVAKISIPFLWVLLFVEVQAQKIVFSETFTSPATSATYSTTGSISTTPWNLTRSGADFGARINGGILDLTNNASASANANGWAFAYRNISAYSVPFNPILKDNNCKIVWRLNLRQSFSDPSGFSNSIPYGNGVAYVLGCSSPNAGTSGNGYAVVLGNATNQDPIKLIKFSGGLQGSIQPMTEAHYFGAPDYGAEYLSIYVTFSGDNGTSLSNKWTVGSDLDGTSGFLDPNRPLGRLGSAYDDTYIYTPLNYSGCYWQCGNPSTTNTAFFDNVSVTLEPLLPTVQSLSINQSFGNASFQAFPNAFVGWSGFDGSTINTKAQAEATIPVLDADLIPKSGGFTTEPSGGLYGYSSASNGKIAIATSSDAVNGINQPVAGVQ